MLGRTILSILAVASVKVLLLSRDDRRFSHHSDTGIGTRLSAIKLKSMWLTFVPSDRWLWGVVGLFCLLGFLSLNDGMLYTPDSIRYLLWAKSLSQFNGFIDLASAEPTRYVVHAPLFSVLLAPFVAIFPGGVVTAKIVSLALGIVLLLVSYRWMEVHGGGWGARIGTIILAVHPLVLLFSTHILSDVSFAVVLHWCFFVVGNEENKAVSLQGLKLALLVTMAIFLREVGLALWVSVVLFLVWRKHFRAAAVVFLIPLAFYGAWFIRNEILVAGFEQPQIQNSKLFFSHIYTPRTAGMLSELTARILNNGAFYASNLVSLILFPVQGGGSFPVVTNNDPMMPLVTGSLKMVLIPLGLLQVGLVVWGGIVRRRDERLMPLFLLFLACYFGLLLLYPIIDNRFLFPLLPLVLGFALVGASDLRDRFFPAWDRKRLSLGIAAGLFLLLLPNLVWISNLVANNLRSLNTSKEEFETRRVIGEYPELYRKSFRYAGEWITQHADSSTVIATRWKELTFWLEGQKLIEVDPVMSLEAFESILRDYEAGYLVVLSDPSGIRELEFQMVQSRRFRFVPVYRTGSVEVLRVLRPPQESPVGTPEEGWLQGSLALTEEERETRAMFREGTLLLERGDYQRAHSKFKYLWDKSEGSGYAALFTGITLGFAGQAQGAMAVFEEFKRLSQAGSFLQHAWYHQEFLSLLQQSEANPIAGSRALMLRTVAVNYLTLGFRYQARMIIDRAIEADSSYYPALAFGISCALENGDTSGARKYVEGMQSLDPRRPQTLSMQVLFSLFDSLTTISDAKQRVRHLFALSEVLERVGLREYAIDHLLSILEMEPTNVVAMMELGRLYILKRRWAPAAKMWNRAQSLSPDAVTIPDEVLESMERRK